MHRVWGSDAEARRAVRGDGAVTVEAAVRRLKALLAESPASPGDAAEYRYLLRDTDPYSTIQQPPKPKEAS